MEDNSYTKGNERKGLALSGLILSMVALLCSLIVNWRIFAIVLASASIIVSCISLFKAAKYHKPKRMQIAAIVCSIFAIVVASYFLFVLNHIEHKALEGDAMPVKVHEDGIPGSQDPNVDSLK